MNTPVISNSPEETLALGERIASKLKGNELILLDGDLGTGKTVLAKGIFSFFGLDKSEVVSPTFTILNQYAVEDIRLFHLDLYRLTDSKDLNHLPEIDDHLEEGIIVVEWAQYLHHSYFQLSNTILIKIKYTEPEKREITITANKILNN